MTLEYVDKRILENDELNWTEICGNSRAIAIHLKYFSSGVIFIHEIGIQ